MSNCTDKPGALSAFTTEQDTETEMDVLWLYKRSKLRGPGHNLDAAASRPLTLTAPLVGNQTIYPELFFYTTPTAMSLSVSNDALVIAASALIAYVNNASTAVPLVTPSGFQVWSMYACMHVCVGQGWIYQGFGLVRIAYTLTS